MTAVIYWKGDEWVAWDAADPECETIAAAMPQEGESSPYPALASLLIDLARDGYKAKLAE